MAFLKKGSSESTKGELVTVGKDPDSGRDVKFRIRVCPDAQARKIAESYGEIRESQRAFEEKNGRKVYTTLMKARVYEPDDTRKIQRDEALYCWTGAENFAIKALDEAQAKVYAGLLGAEVGVGVDIVLDDRLTEEIKRELLDNDQELVVLILTKAAELKKKEGDLRGNS